MGLAGQAEERSQLVFPVVVIILFVDIQITARPAPPRVWPSSGARYLLRGIDARYQLHRKLARELRMADLLLLTAKVVERQVRVGFNDTKQRRIDAMVPLVRTPHLFQSEAILS